MFGRHYISESTNFWCIALQLVNEISLLFKIVTITNKDHNYTQFQTFLRAWFELGGGNDNDKASFHTREPMAVSELYVLG